MFERLSCMKTSQTQDRRSVPARGHVLLARWGSVYLRKVLSRLSGGLPKADPVFDATDASLDERRRECKAVLVRWFPPVKDSPSGEKTAPEQGFPTGFRTRGALRRENGAGAGPSYATAAKNASPASRAPACYARLAATNREDAYARREGSNHRERHGRGP